MKNIACFSCYFKPTLLNITNEMKLVGGSLNLLDLFVIDSVALQGKGIILELNALERESI